MKTILFLLARYPGFGGIETVTTVLANRLSGCYRVLLCSSEGEHEESLLQQLKPSVAFYTLPHHAPRADAENTRFFRDLLEREKVDVVVYQDSYFTNEYLLEVLPQGCRLIVAEHNAPDHVWRWADAARACCPWWNVYRRLRLCYSYMKGKRADAARRSRLYRKADRYLVLSEHFKEPFISFSSVAATEKLGALGNPLSFERPVVDWQRKEKRVLFVGQFVSIKGLPRLLRIWKRIEHLVPEWRLTLVGGGPCLPEVEHLIGSLGLQQVELPGFSSQVREHYLRAQIFCLCSTFEGFPMVLPEAMSCGVVPVAFNSFAALADIITDGEDGYAVSPYDEAAFAQRLLALMQQDTLRERMAQAALSKSAAFDAETITQRWIELLESL